MKRKIFIPGTLLIIMALFTVAGLTLLNPPVQTAAAQTEGAPPRIIQVSGQGKVTARPDTAIVRLGVEAELDPVAVELAASAEAETAVSVQPCTQTIQASVQAT
jgi:uncharacterized protein YggE